MNLRLSHKYAIVLTLFAMCVIVALALTLLTQFNKTSRNLHRESAEVAEQALLTQLERRAVSASAVLADNLVNLLYRSDYALIDELVHSAGEQEGVLSVCVTDPLGVILHDGTSNLAGYGQILDDEFTKKARATGKTAAGVKGKNFIAVSEIRAGSEVLGYARVVLPIGTIQEDLANLKDRLTTVIVAGRIEYRISLVIVGIIVLAVSVLISLVVAQRLTRPISVLVETTEKIKRGDFATPGFHEHRDDEIGKLSASMASMAKDLKKKFEHQFRQLRKSEQQYSAIVEDQTEMICRHTPDGTRTFVNVAYCEFHGKSREELIGQLACVDLTADDLKRHRRLNESLTPDNPSAEFEMSLTGPEGQTIWQTWLKRAIFDDRGKVIEYQEVGRDITESKRAEEALRQAKEVAELANRAKTEFLANMSHELRTPLNSIIGFSEMIGIETFGPVGNPKYGEYADDIKSSGRHLLELIDDILDVSRIESNNLPLDEKVVDVNRTVESCRRLICERALRAGLNLDLRGPEDQPNLYADERRVKQILLNLLGNAIKFTPSGGTVSLRSGVNEENRFVFTVSDTGNGIDPDYLNQVLTPFRQVEGSMTRIHDGVGLGLPLAKSLAELHGGELTLESTPGIGTKVMVAFPAERLVQGH